MPDVGLRQRRRVVDAVAGHGDALPAFACRRLTTAAFCSGSTSASTSSMPTERATASAVDAVVAGEHHDPQPFVVQRRDRFARSWP